MEDLIRVLKPNANKKYYVFVSSYLEKMMLDSDVEIDFSVENLIKDTVISRPTFYAYFDSLEDFYRELINIFFGVIPGYMAKKSIELKTDDLLEVAFNMKIGVAINNIRKTTAIFSSLNPFWKKYYQHAVNQFSEWYIREYKTEPEIAKQQARFVLNELILHPQLYYSDLEIYKSLMVHQRVAQQVA